MSCFRKKWKSNDVPCHAIAIMEQLSLDTDFNKTSGNYKMPELLLSPPQASW